MAGNLFLILENRIRTVVFTFEYKECPCFLYIGDDDNSWKRQDFYPKLEVFCESRSIAHGISITTDGPLNEALYNVDFDRTTQEGLEGLELPTAATALLIELLDRLLAQA
jgi:hypothetical protein